MLVGSLIQKEALDLWGAEKQTDMIEEEANELVGALIKYRRNPCEEARNNVIDELADMFVVMEYGPMIFDSDKIQDRVNFKLGRLRQRIDEKRRVLKIRTEKNF